MTDKVISVPSKTTAKQTYRSLIVVALHFRITCVFNMKCMFMITSICIWLCIVYLYIFGFDSSFRFVFDTC